LSSLASIRYHEGIDQQRGRNAGDSISRSQKTGGSPMKYDEFIHNRGREIKGTRITVYSILDYLLAAWEPDRIAAWFRLNSEQVRAAIDYINDHKVEVMAHYAKILERCERGNPPELQAKLDESHHRFQVLKSKIQQLEDTDPEARKAKIAVLLEEHLQAGRQGDANAGDNGRS
jgi:hypothetical protein